MSCLPGKADTHLSTSAKCSHHTIGNIMNSGQMTNKGRRRLGRISIAISLWTQSLGIAHTALVYDSNIEPFSLSFSLSP